MNLLPKYVQPFCSWFPSSFSSTSSLLLPDDFLCIDDYISLLLLNWWQICIHVCRRDARTPERKSGGSPISYIASVFFLYSVASDFCEVNIPEKIQIKTIYPYGEGMVVFILGSPIFLFCLGRLYTGIPLSRGVWLGFRTIFPFAVLPINSRERSVFCCVCVCVELLALCFVVVVVVHTI